MSTQLFLVSTGSGLVTLVAAIDDGLFPAETGRDAAARPDRAVDDGRPRRVLVLTDNSLLPEGAAPVSELPGYPGLVTRFDEVVDFNTTIAPLHPVGWTPAAPELPVWERFLRQSWGLHGPVRLVLDHVQTAPALTLARIFADAPLDVYLDGLSGYGPTPGTLPDDVGWRVERLLHLDLVPGVTPLLLSEWDVAPTVVGWPAFRAAVEQLPVPTPRWDQPFALVVGQHLAASGLLTTTEQTALDVAMVLGCGTERVVFTSHPMAPPSGHTALRAAAAEAGVDLQISTTPELAETWFAGGSVRLVVGCSSTALMTAASGYGCPVRRHGTELLLHRLPRVEHAHRVPATLVDALLPDLTRTPRPDPDPSGLLNAVGYAMQPEQHPHRREAAVAFLAARPDARARYVGGRRLADLGLPGADAGPRPDTFAGPLRRRARQVVDAITDRSPHREDDLPTHARRRA